MSGWKEKASGMGLLFLRVTMGSGIAYHGYQKIFGGFIGKLAEGVKGMGFPYPEAFAWAAALSEFLGGILIALGVGTRAAAFFVFSTMAVAAFLAHAADPFNKKELALAYWAISGALMLTGAGPYSLDARLGRKGR